MPLAFDASIKESGTRFRLFPQPRFLPAFSQPETVVVSVPPAAITPGPADARMFVVDAVDKLPFGPGEGPPYSGPANAPVKPGPTGHFDHLDPVKDERAFRSATMYATVRRTLDIWTAYFGQEIPWHFASHFPQLLLIPLVEWDNAHSGFGFLEFGYGRTPLGTIDRSRPFCENFDVLAHELGHSIIFSRVGIPSAPALVTAEYRGFHESAADLVAIVASLHFDAVVTHLLEESSGNLFTANELSRVGELSASRQIRSAFNAEKLSTVDREPHNLSQPLTGAVFDIFVECFQNELVRRGLISQDLAGRSFNPDLSHAGRAQVQKDFDKAFKRDPAGFAQALLVVRDDFGRLLARAWASLSPDGLRYSDVAAALLAADGASTGGRNRQTIVDCFAWREISVVPEAEAFRVFHLGECGPR